MSRMNWPAAPGPERLVLLSVPGRDAALTAVAVPLTVGVVIALMVGQIQRHVEGRQRPA